MEQYELLRRLTEALDRLGIPYLVTGSIATIAYGEPRFTIDIDVVIDLRPEQVDSFCAIFPEPEFYCPRDFAAEAVRKQFQFNVLQPETGLKIDVIVATGSAFDRTRLRRAQRLPAQPGFEAWFASPEDVILKKLEYYKEGGSEKHIRDILGILRIRGERVDRGYIADWADRLGVTAEWELILARLSPERG
jgi:Nucleotidyl transferase AbiEii toxin, Type IV TA system